MSDEAGAKKRFIITGEAWYSDAAMSARGRNVVAEMSCGLDPVDADGNDLGGTYGEWVVVWKQISPGTIFTQVQAFDDGWKQLVESGFHEVMADLANSSPSVHELATALLARGWVDCTERQDPAR